MSKLKMAATGAFLFLFLQNAYSQKTVLQAVLKELEVAEAKMFNAMLSGDKEYCKNYLTDNWFSINADGSVQTKEGLLADTTFGKFFSLFTNKLFEKKIKVYGNVGIITGRAQAFMKETLAVEYLYTAVFVKENNKWMYANWQGTISKDSPKPPPMPQK